MLFFYSEIRIWSSPLSHAHPNWPSTLEEKTPGPSPVLMSLSDKLCHRKISTKPSCKIHTLEAFRQECYIKQSFSMLIMQCLYTFQPSSVNWEQCDTKTIKPLNYIESAIYKKTPDDCPNLWGIVWSVLLPLLFLKFFLLFFKPFEIKLNFIG